MTGYKTTLVELDKGDYKVDLITQKNSEDHFSHLYCFPLGFAVVLPHISVASTRREEYAPRETDESDIYYRSGPYGLDWDNIEHAQEQLAGSINSGIDSCIIGELGMKGNIYFQSTGEGDFEAWGRREDRADKLLDQVGAEIIRRKPKGVILPRFDELGLYLLLEYIQSYYPVSFEELLTAVALRRMSGRGTAIRRYRVKV